MSWLLKEAIKEYPYIHFKGSMCEWFCCSDGDCILTKPLYGYDNNQHKWHEHSFPNKLALTARFTNTCGGLCYDDFTGFETLEEFHSQIFVEQL